MEPALADDCVGVDHAESVLQLPRRADAAGHQLLDERHEGSVGAGAEEADAVHGLGAPSGCVRACRLEAGALPAYPCSLPIAMATKAGAPLRANARRPQGARA